MDSSLAARALLGFAAAAVAVLIFHQGGLSLMHLLTIPGFETQGLPYNMSPMPPFGIPAMFNLCFWAGLFGALFGMLDPVLPRPMWVPGIVMGLIAAGVGLGVSSLMQTDPIGGGWELETLDRTLALAGLWGFGLGLIYPMVAPTALSSG